jgi:hypothetical protein
LLVLIAGYLLPNRSEGWLQTVAEMAAIAFAGVLLVATTIAISRSPWAMLLELLSLVGLLGLAYADRKQWLLPRWLGPAAALGVALLLQTHLLRWLGPEGDLDLGDIARMRLPTLISLLWAAMGGALTVWARRMASRPVWVAGATLLVAAAVKLVLVDFGSLGQLANILAVIAAGIVFMLVGWLAPLPPPAPPRAKVQPHVPPEVPPAQVLIATPGSTPRQSDKAQQSAKAQWQAPSGSESDYWERNSRQSQHSSHEETPLEASSNRKTAWIIAILATLVLPLAQCSRTTLDLIRHGLGFGHRSTATGVMPDFVVSSSPSAADIAAAAAARATAEAAADAAARASLPVPSEASAPEVDVAGLALPVPVETECSQWVAKLPTDYVVYAAGAYKGQELDFTVDGSNHRAGGFDVTIHLPDRNVVLVLGAYEPSIWRVKASTATHIAGVWMSGYYPSRITGLDVDTPVLRSSQSQGGGCPAFYLTSENQQEAARAVAATMGRRIDKVILASNGRVAIGHTELTPYYQVGNLRSFESFRDKSQPLAGDKGIEELLRSGQLRNARKSDYDLWRAANGGRQSDYPPSSMGGSDILFRTYVVNRQMTIPADLYGAHSVTLIVPRGVARPQGDPGHSRILDMNE